ncbi:MAG: TIR domain-containing protein, partial [Candidatus Aminicenantes bacterium]|nr:TIR domain-containing protein [Candidatus Aminicenantes bacterium]
MNRQPEVTVFVSYAHKDKEFVDKLMDDLIPYTKHSKSIKWDLCSDRKIPMGEEWHRWIQEKVVNCDFALLLVSQNFLASDYILKEEFLTFLKRSDEKEIQFFPLLLRQCDFTRWPDLAKRQFFMPPGKDYDREKIDNIAFGDMVKFRTDNGMLTQGQLYDQYILNLSKALEKIMLDQIKKKQSPTGKQLKGFKMMKSSRELLIGDLLPKLRSKINTDFYWEREFDQSIFTHLMNSKSVLVVGNSLSGKTRALFEAIKKRPDSIVLIPFDYSLPINNYELPANRDKKIIAVFDDFDLFIDRYSKKGIEKLLFKLIDNDILIAATCRSGNELKYLEDQLSHHVTEILRTVVIKRMNPKQVAEFNNYLDEEIKPKREITLDTDGFDHNIGSYFLELSLMQQRYSKLEEITKKYNTTSPKRLPREILIALKYFYYLQNTVGKTTFLTDKIKDYCERSLLGKRPNAPTGSFYSQLDQITNKTGKTEFIPSEWHDALDLLSSSVYKLNFIDWHGEHIQAEEAYLEKVIESDMNSENIIESIKNAYKDENIRRHGFYANIYEFIKLIDNAKGLQEGLILVKKLKGLGLKPNTFIYNTLMNKSGNFQEAMGILEKMKEVKIAPDEITYTTLISKATDFEQALGVLEKMKEV